MTLLALFLFACNNIDPEQGKQVKSKPVKIEPVKTDEATGAIDIAAGESHMCALLSTNRVKCWGSNSEHQLDIAQATNSSKKTFDLRQEKLSQISAGHVHNCAILQSDGIPVCWGKNGDWLMVPNTKIKYISAGTGLTCFIKEDDLLECVGELQWEIHRIKAADILREGFDPETGDPKQDFSAKKFKSVQTGQGRVCALGYDDVVYCMGSNQFGAAKSGLQKVKAFAVSQWATYLLDDQNKLVIAGAEYSPKKNTSKIADYKKLKYKSIFGSSGGFPIFLTASGNKFDDGSSIPENTTVFPIHDLVIEEKVLKATAGERGSDPHHTYCAIMEDKKVKCRAWDYNGVENTTSDIVKNIPKEILYNP